MFNALISGTSFPTANLLKGRENEFSISHGCVMYGLRVCIPFSLQKEMLEELHDGHLGMTKMKSLARSYCYWYKIDADIERKCKSCESCCSVLNSPAKVNFHHWEGVTAPMQRVHIDYAGPFMKQNFLIVVDAYSKWVEVYPVDDTSAATTIDVLRLHYFARYGIPHVLVSDNGSNFASAEFREFVEFNGVKHVFAPPYHPSSNGLAERSVQTFKNAMKSALFENPEWSFSKQLAHFLITYRRAPHAITGATPCALFLNRSLRTRLDFIVPNAHDEEPKLTCENEEVVDKKQGRFRSLKLGDNVQVRDHRSKHPKWINGFIVEKCGKVIYVVNVNGKLWRRHVDHIRFKSLATSGGVTDATVEDRSYSFNVTIPEDPVANTSGTVINCAGTSEIAEPVVSCSRKSSRVSRKPAYLNDYDIDVFDDT
jgi:hypothetical protein